LQEKPNLAAAGGRTFFLVLVEKNRVPIRGDQRWFSDDEVVGDWLSAMCALKHICDYLGHASALSGRADFYRLGDGSGQKHRNLNFVVAHGCQEE
jgi:hypothetical protein